VTYRVIVTPTADNEAMEAVRWYAERSPDAAQHWHDGLALAIDSLAGMPSRCPVSPDDSQALGCEVRILLYGKRRGVYRILFSIVGDTVWVLRIRHRTRRSPLDPDS
jgi:plasmid stabilization system protein ParE